jgi:hypothetical protein
MNRLMDVRSNLLGSSFLVGMCDVNATIAGASCVSGRMDGDSLEGSGTFRKAFGV